MTPAGLDRLLAASSGASAAPLRSLVSEMDDPVEDGLARAAAGPLAHLLCRSLAAGLSEGTYSPDRWAAAIMSGLARQSSLLAVQDATDELLSSVEFVRSHGAGLYDTLLRGHANAIAGRPLLAAAFAEGALRLAIVGIGNPLRTLTVLTPEDVTGLDGDYAERLPRLVGAALDAWWADRSAGSALRQTLTALQGVPDASADATFEQGLDLLRQAAGGAAGEVPQLLVAARGHFANVEAAEEARHDAALYGAGIDAIMAFFRSSPEAMRAARAVLSTQLDQRAAWLLRTNVPAWRRPRTEAACAWGRLAVILDRALRTTAAPIWLDAWSALESVLDAYILDRSVVPVPGAVEPGGFSRLIQPMVESALAGRRSLLDQVRYAVDEAERASWPRERMDQLRLLRNRLGQAGSPADEADPAVPQRLFGVAPTLLAELGPASAAMVARQLDDEGLRLVEGAMYSSAVTRSVRRDPVIARLLQRLTLELQACPDYAGETRQAFDAVVEETVTFLATRHDLPRSRAIDYLRPANPPPPEACLQDDFADWLRRGHLGGRVDIEVPHVATGRADIKLGFGTTRFFVEVKRELRDGSAEALERSYLTQAADYCGTSAALGVLLVLDLTPHPAGVRHLSECAWVARCRPDSSTVDRYVVVGVVIGNRGTPSSYSRAAKTA